MKKGFFYNLFLVALIVLCAALIYSVAVENKNDDVTNPDLNGDVINPGGSLDKPDDGTVEDEPTDKAPVYGLNDLLCVYGTEPTIDGEKVIFTEQALLTCVNEEKSFELGYSISADIKGIDTGFVFFVNGNGLESYWEDLGTNYFLAYISENGYLRLLHVEDFEGETSTWESVSQIENYDENATYNIKVVTNDIDEQHYGINFYLNSQYVGSVSKDKIQQPITGTGWGLRSGGNATIENLRIEASASNDFPVEDENPIDYSTYGFYDLTSVHGNATLSNGAATFNGSPTLSTCTNKNKPFELGCSISADIYNYSNDVGIVFFVDNNGLDVYCESDGVSYYFLFVSHDGYLYLGHVATISTGTWYEVRKVAIDNYNPTQTYNVKASTYEIDSVRYGIDLYLDGVKMMSVQMNYADFPINGTGWGVRSAGDDRTMISNLKIE